jgi:hypothetical protein
MRGAWRGDSWLSHGGDLLGLGVIAVVCTALSIRLFRWE